ncbi:MAG: peptidoglycan DD-metalloendopeptidase family protein, partial [Acutalibacteraceae bacterium]
MAKMSFEKSKFRKFMETKGLYVALAAVMTAAGIGSYSAYHISQKQNTADVGEALSNIEATEPSASSKESVSEADEPQSSSDNKSADKSSVPQTASSKSDTASSEAPDNVTASFFVLPVTDGDILKEYDEKELQFSNTYKDWRLHTAVDFAAEAGSAVKSAGHGRVTDVYYDDTLGETVAIDHGNGIVAYYCGLNKSPSVKAGDEVAAGFQIGAVDVVPCECVDTA